MGEQKVESVLQTINLIKFFLTAYDTSKEKFSSKSKYLKPIFAKILMSMGSLSNNLISMKNAIPGLKLIQEILVILEKEPQLESFGLMAKGIKQFVAFYCQFIKYIIEDKFEKEEKSWKDVESAFYLATQNVVALQVYVDSERESTEWLDLMIHCIIDTKILPEIILICIEGVIAIYEESKKGKPFYRFLQNCIQNENEIVSGLWDIIGCSSNDRKVVELIIRADDVMNKSLTFYVIKELLDEIIPSKVMAINRLSLFWKLAAEYHPKFIPFQYDPYPIFHMCDFLNNDHPLVRHSSKSWLSESTPRLGRILDPNIIQLMKGPFAEIVQTSNGKLIHDYIYDHRIIIDAFKKLRSILITSKIELMNFMMESKISDNLIRMYKEEKCICLFDLLNEKQNYLQLLLFLSIKFIRGEVSEKYKKEFTSDNAAVNACGCEFLELLLSSIEPNEKSPDVASCVIKPLIIGLQNSFESKDSIMQVEILKLLRLIQFKCFAQSKKYSENCMRIFTDTNYMKILGEGLKSEVSYVRTSYISYIKSTLPLYTTFMGENLVVTIGTIMSDLLNNLACCTASSSIRSGEEKVIATESDILEILGGLKAVIHHFFFEADNEIEREDRKALMKWINIPIDKKAKSFIEKTKVQMLALMGGILIKSLRIWKAPSPRLPRNFNLAYNGILSFTNTDYSDILTEYFKIKLTYELVSKELTNYQDSLIEIIKPIIEMHPQEVISSIIEVWQEEQQRKNNESLQKIIDMLVLLRVPVENVIQGISVYLEKCFDPKLKKTLITKTGIELKYSIALKEASICLFLYSYLVHTYDWYTKNDKPAEKANSLKTMWLGLCSLSKQLMQFKTPTTLCWLFDIMYIMGLKYDPREILNSERKVRNGIEEVLTQISTDTSQIAASGGNLKPEERFTMEMPFNPSFFNLYYHLEFSLEEKKYAEDEETGLSFKLRRLMPQFRLITYKKPGSNGKNNSIRGEICINYLRGCCFLTMKEMLYDLVEKLLLNIRKDKMGTVLVNVMNNLFPLIAQRDELVGEYATDVLYSILRSIEEYKSFRKQIVDIFNSDEFFWVNQHSLKKWRLILNWLLSWDKNELFNELLKQLNARSLISTKSYENTQRYMALKRLGFLIFAGNKDHFEESYRSLVFEGFKDQENPYLVIQYLTLLRVMLLRFGQLNEASKETAKNMQSLLPNVMSKLIQIFQDPDTKSKEKPLLILAALKLIELMSVLNIEDYTLFQWVFLNDSYGWEIIENEAFSHSSAKSSDKGVREAFVPLCISTLSSGFTATFMNEKATEEVKEDSLDDRMEPS